MCSGGGIRNQEFHFNIQVHSLPEVQWGYQAGHLSLELGGEAQARDSNLENDWFIDDA